MKYITIEQIHQFKQHLLEEERASATIEKYMRDINALVQWLGGKEMTKAESLAYKTRLSQHYAAASVNSILSSLNSFFSFLGWHELKIKMLKIQRKIFVSSEKALTRNEYERLLRASKSNKSERLYLLMQTICSTGIRVSELQYITVEAIQAEQAEMGGTWRNIITHIGIGNSRPMPCFEKAKL